MRDFVYLLLHLFLILVGTCLYWFIIGLIHVKFGLMIAIVGGLLIAACSLCGMMLIVLMLPAVSTEESPSIPIAAAFYAVFLFLLTPATSHLMVEQRICESGLFELSKQAEECDYLCFGEIRADLQKTFHFEIVKVDKESNRTVRTYAYAPLQIAEQESELWVDVKDHSMVEGRCVWLFGSSEVKQRIQRHLGGKKTLTLGKMVRSPSENIKQKRMNILFMVLILKGLIVSFWLYFSRQNASAS